MTACVFIAELARAGVDLPNELSVIGLDGMPISMYGYLPVTVATRPAAKIARQCVNYLLDRIVKGYDGPPRKVTVNGELIIRESTVAPSGHL
jgi:LacI family transcriptional regulator